MESQFQNSEFMGISLKSQAQNTDHDRIRQIIIMTAVLVQ